MPWLVGLIGSALGSFVFRLLSSLGIGAVTYFVVLPNITNFFRAKLYELPPDILQVLGVLNFDICFTILISAYSAKGLSGLFFEKK